jgi:hypothetical protein
MYCYLYYIQIASYRIYFSIKLVFILNIFYVTIASCAMLLINAK